MDLLDAIDITVRTDHIVAAVLGKHLGPEFDNEWAHYMPEDIDPDQERLCEAAHAVLAALAERQMLTPELADAFRVEARG